MEKTITLTEDEVATLGTLIDCMRVAELALKKAMPTLDKVADDAYAMIPYE